MWLKNCARPVYCINERCFDNSLAAGRYLMELSSRGEPVTVNQRLDTGACFVPGAKKG